MDEKQELKSEKQLPIFNVHFESKAKLYAAYMPFIKTGGLFIPTTREYELGDQAVIELKLLDEPEMRVVPGKVVWITPIGAQGGSFAGVGIQFFGENAAEIRKKIEKMLAGMINSDLKTDTM